MHLPIEFSKKRGEIETKIIEHSNKIFTVPIIGIIIAVIINAIYINLWYNKKSLLGIFIFSYLIFLILHIIIYQLTKNE